ncbi:embryonic protein UVS.2-like [Petromyzon marinus]|uniref:embryonic protein UVS.2-like n=1 Tax=Petromyzon marinus TaxID=7757 RepID=UPI003F7236BB
MRLFTKLRQEVKGISMRGAPSPCGVKDGVSAGRVGRWPQGPGGQVYVPYKLSTAFYDYDVEAITRATQEFEKKTCVQFKPHAGEMDFIHIQDLGG